MALDPVTGNPLWSSGTIGSIHWQSPIVVNGRVYVTDESARLWAFETGSPTATPTLTARPTATSTPPPTATFTPTPTPTPAPTLAFFTLVPCRVVDTRNAPGTFGGPGLEAGGDRAFPVTGQCGLPATARAISANVTITSPTAPGDLRIYPFGTSIPLTSVINYSAGQTRANNTIAALGSNGAFVVHCDQGSGTVHFILDVNGYFQ
jgi:hypothetical protein